MHWSNHIFNMELSFDKILKHLLYKKTVTLQNIQYKQYKQNPLQVILNHIYKSRILKVTDMHEYQVALFIHDYKTHKLPISFNEMFKFNYDDKQTTRPDKPNYYTSNYACHHFLKSYLDIIFHMYGIDGRLNLQTLPHINNWKVIWIVLSSYHHTPKWSDAQINIAEIGTQAETYPSELLNFCKLYAEKGMSCAIIYPPPPHHHHTTTLHHDPLWLDNMIGANGRQLLLHWSLKSPYVYVYAKLYCLCQNVCMWKLSLRK